VNSYFNLIKSTAKQILDINNQYTNQYQVPTSDEPHVDEVIRGSREIFTRRIPAEKAEFTRRDIVHVVFTRDKRARLMQGIGESGSVRSTTELCRHNRYNMRNTTTSVSVFQCHLSSDVHILFVSLLIAHISHMLKQTKNLFSFRKEFRGF
jgi:hypothetical protein